MNEQIEQKNTTMRAVIYARVSTEEQAKHNFSLESQVDLSRKWVVDHHFKLACEPFIDAGESAKTMNRKALVRLLEYCRTHKGKVDAVLIYKIDRIARNMADHVAIRSLLSQYGVRIYSVTEPIGGDNSTSKLLENVMASFAQFDNDAKSERTKDGINKRVSKGEISWVAPVGYNNVMKPGGYKTIVPDPERAPMVKKLFEEYAKGIYKESEITRMANRLGFTTGKGNKIRQQVIHKMLRSKIYTGTFMHKGKENQGVFEPLITTELFERVQFYIRTKSGRLTNHPKRALNPDFPLRVTARCVCGGRFTGSWSRGQLGGRYAYYHCAKCHKKSVKKEVFEEHFMEFLTRLAPKKEEMGMFRSLIIDYWEGKHTELNTDIATIDRNIEKVEEEKVRVVELTKQNVFDSETAKEELDRIKEKITVLRLNRNDLQIEEFDIETCVNYCLYFMVNIYKLWYEVKLTDKIKFQEMIFPEGVLYDYSAFGTAKTAHIYTLKQLIDTPNSTMVQHIRTKRVLMVAYTDQAGYIETLETGEGVFWSRKRKERWKKGETSGHTLKVHQVLIDCDEDALIYLVTPNGPTCHTEAQSCFYRNTIASKGYIEPALKEPTNPLPRLIYVRVHRRLR